MDAYKKVTFVRFCFASVLMLQEDLALPTEKLICLCKECIEMAKHFNDACTMVGSGVQFVLHCNSIGRHADSLRCLKEMLPLPLFLPPGFELLVHKYLSLTFMELKESDRVVFHARKWIKIARNIEDKENEIYGLREMGSAFLSLARYDDAIDCGKKCLEIAQEIDSTKNEMMAYDCIRMAYKYMQKYNDTILYAHKLLDCAIEINDQQAMVTAYLELGRAHLALNNYQDAADFGKKCIEIARELEDRCEVYAYLLMGQIYEALSDYDNAIICCKKCIELAITISNKHAEAHAYSVLGSIYCSLEKYDDAISNCNKCLHIDKEDNEEKGADARAYLTLGKVNKSSKKYDEGIQNLKQCIDIVSNIGCEKETGVGACFCLGDIYETLEQNNDAVHYYKKCIDMAQETGQTETTEARACLGLSSLYLKMNKRDSAIQYGKKCIDISQETENKKSEMAGHFLLARVYIESIRLNDASLSIDAGMVIALEVGDKRAEEGFKEIRSGIYAAVGFLDKACDVPSAKDYLEVPTCSEDDLLENLEQAAMTGDKFKRLKAFIRLYRFYCFNNEHGKAVSCLERLKEMDIDLSVNLFCFTEIGKSYQLMGQTDLALHCYEEGLPTAESCSNNIQRSRFYYCIGKLLFLLNRELNLAERYFREAIRCFEEIFRTLGGRDEFKISIFDQYIDSYKMLALLLIKGEQITEAILVLDRCRARALKDLMISNFKMEQDGSNDEHLEYINALSLATRSDFSISYFSLCFNVFLKFFLGGENCHFAVHPDAIPMKDFLRMHIDTLFDEIGVSEVVNCEDRSLDKKQDIQKEQRTSEEEYEELNQQSASLLNLDSKRGESLEYSAESKGSTLEALFCFLECDRILSSKQDEVVIIPEGPLYQVPFPALRDPRTGKYLSEPKRIRLAPSLATLKHFEDFPTDRTSNAQPLIIGDPLVGKVMMDGEEQDIEPLPGAREEAAEISLILNTPALLTRHATKPAVIKRLQEGVSVVHIAAHGILSKATIVLAPSPEIRATKIPDEEDYMLTMADVQQAKVRAQLVVLSCCHSGRGEIRAEGVVGMCRAFLASGARAVVASLWAIDDDATFEFMQKFYLSLKDGKSASASLQQAMKEMRNTTNYSRPKYWAPFFLMGDDVTLKFN